MGIVSRWKKMMNERQQFQSMGFMSKKHSRSNKKKQKSKRWGAFRPFTWLFVWNKSKSSFDDAASPDTTALMGYEEFSVHNDPFHFNSFSSDSDFAVAPDSMQERFPYWANPNKMITTKSEKTRSPALDYEKHKKTSTPRLRRSLDRILHSAKMKPSTPDTEGHSTSEYDLEDDLDSRCFSISSDRHTSAFDTVKIHVTTNDGKPECISPSDVSVYTTPSLSATNADEKSRISLGQFMEERKRESTSVSGPALNLGEISALDNASVNSSLLEVSYDENYPQLVLQPSVDGSTKGTVSTFNSSGTLGATYPHPASGRSVSSFETAKKNTSCTRWLNDSIDNVWKQIDQSKKARKEIDDGETFEDGGTIANDGSFREDRTFANESLHTYPTVSNESAEWADDAVAWSFSGEGSVKTFSNIIERDVLQPILKPICHLVEATEIPSTSMCGSKVRPPKNNAAAAETGASSSSSYRMSPRMPSHRPSTKM